MTEQHTTGPRELAARAAWEKVAQDNPDLNETWETLNEYRREVFRRWVDAPLAAVARYYADEARQVKARTENPSLARDVRGDYFLEAAVLDRVAAELGGGGQ